MWNIARLVEKSRFWGCLKSTSKLIFSASKVNKKSILEAKKSIKKAHRLPNFKGRACNFTALHESNFAAYFTGCQLFGPEKLV